MDYPFIMIIGPSKALMPHSFDQEKGLILREQLGSHGIWAAKVPFIPALDAEELTRLGAGRINKIVWRQFRFLYDLAQARDHLATYELRFIARPSSHPAELGQVENIFFGKVFHETRSQVAPTALRLWDKFASHFPLEDPFDYPLCPIVDPAEFQRVYAPIPQDHLTELESIAEIRRFEEMPMALDGASPPRHGDYIVHPFVPTLDFSAMGRLFETLATQPCPCFASVSLRPIVLFDLETYFINEMASRFRDISRDDSEVTSEYARSRARMGAQIYKALMQEREFLTQVKVQVVGLPRAPRGLIEALGSELMNNGRNPFPTKWVSVTPADMQELAVAKRNLELLEHDDWGQSLAPPVLRRLRTIADVQQAAGAFRLPIPPESGFMPGILVKSEPFVAPQDHLEATLAGSEQSADADQIVMGEIYHRGNPTGHDFTVPVQSLTRHSLIGGSTGSGKSTTIMALLAQLWSASRQVPFLVLYPLDKPDYRTLLSVPRLRDDLLVFTLGDETVSPFRFNPFAVPDGVLLKTHLSRLMRAFSAAFDLIAPLPMVYREALRLTYRRVGWDVVTDRGETGRRYPTMAEFHDVIEEVTTGLQYGREVQDNVHQASVIRIADLLDNAGSVLNVRESPPFAILLQRPVVMELGRIGSQEDTSLLMGFLLIMLAETLEKTPRATPHITVVEEAHRLMARSNKGDNQGRPMSSAGEDFSNILSEIRGFNAGVLIAEQMPSRLVEGAIGNTYLKVMHWLEDSTSFGLFADIMNLNDRQRSYARRLKAGEAVVRSRFGRPVHIKVRPLVTPNEDGSTFDDCWLAAHTPQRARAAGISVPELEIATTTPDAPPESDRSAAERIFMSPLGRACAFCRPLLLDGRCLHRDAVVAALERPEGRELAQAFYQGMSGESGLNSEQVEQMTAAAGIVMGCDQAHSRGAAYCFFAHVSHKLFTGRFSDTERNNAAAFLRAFHWTPIARRGDDE